MKSTVEFQFTVNAVVRVVLKRRALCGWTQFIFTDKVHEAWRDEAKASSERNR